jgi:hypothetical protein
MYRRSLIKLVGSLVGSMLYGRVLPMQIRNAPRNLTFFVAGVRFHTPGSAAVGDLVIISATSYQGSRCFEVLAGQSRIGYVPRGMIQRLPPLPQLSGVISAVNLNALPWKRIEVSPFV